MSKHSQPMKLFAWVSYDWAASSFPIIVTTFIFSTYFTSPVAANQIIGTYQWASATAFAGIMIALMGPIFGAIADHGGFHKRWLMIFTVLCVIATALLWFAYPEKTAVTPTLACVILGTISLEIGLVFYNAFLPHIAPEGYIGRISGWGWGSGYVGGIIALSIALFVFIKPEPTWLNIDTAEQVRICGPLAAIWFALFCITFFILIPDVPSTGLTAKQAIKKGFQELASTLKGIPREKNLVLYLLAHLIYADGLNTLFAFGGIYAAGTFGMTMSGVVLFGITMNVAAGAGAILLAWVDDYIGSKPTILFSLTCLILLGIPLLFTHNKAVFWILGLLLGTFIGPVQAASRSMMTRLSPPNKTTEMFGLYAFSGKITSFIGPWLLGLATYYFQSQRAGMATILIFFIVGGSLMWLVKEENK